jgi:hypothetical protein
LFEWRSERVVEEDVVLLRHHLRGKSLVAAPEDVKAHVEAVDEARKWVESNLVVRQTAAQAVEGREQRLRALLQRLDREETPAEADENE